MFNISPSAARKLIFAELERNSEDYSEKVIKTRSKVKEKSKKRDQRIKLNSDQLNTLLDPK